MTYVDRIRADLRSERFARTYSAVDRILSRPVKEVIVQYGGPAPAWTDGETITLNSAMLPALTGMDNTLVWMGANYHELGHTLYSPRFDSQLMTRLRQVRAGYPGIDRIHNLVEDQRQERLLIAQFAPLTSYLQVAVADLIVKGGDVTQTWPLLAGRTWIDSDIRKASFNEYAEGAAAARQLADLIGEYQLLADPAEAESAAALRILLDIHELLVDTNAQMPNGCGADAPRAGDDQPAAAPDAPTGMDGMDEDDTDDTDGDGEAGAEGDTEGEGDEDEGTDGGAGSDDDTEGDTQMSGDAEGETEGETEGNDEGAGASDGDSPTVKADPTAGDIAEAIKDTVAEAISNDDDLADDIQQTMDALDGRGSLFTDNERWAVNYNSVADEQLLTMRYEMEDYFRDLQSAVLPHWERRVDHGRLNVRRYLTQETFDYSELFDRFDPGMQDETSIDVTILLDVSSSMSGNEIKRASEAAWVIRHAAKAVDAPCRIVSYNSSAMTAVADTDQIVGEQVPVYVASGGTNPTDAVIRAVDAIDAAEAAHKLVIILTDGDWGGGQQAVRELSQRDDVHTIGVVIDAYMTEPPKSDPQYDRRMTDYQHRLRRNQRRLDCCDHVIVSNDGRDMATVFGTVTQSIMDKVLAEAR